MRLWKDTESWKARLKEEDDGSINRPLFDVNSFTSHQVCMLACLTECVWAYMSLMIKLRNTYCTYVCIYIRTYICSLQNSKMLIHPFNFSYSDKIHALTHTYIHTYVRAYVRTYV